LNLAPSPQLLAEPTKPVTIDELNIRAPCEVNRVARELPGRNYGATCRSCFSDDTFELSHDLYVHQPHGPMLTLNEQPLGSPITLEINTPVGAAGGLCHAITLSAKHFTD
jgi:hypothetical protein